MSYETKAEIVAMLRERLASLGKARLKRSWQLDRFAMQRLDGAAAELQCILSIIEHPGVKHTSEEPT